MRGLASRLAAATVALGLVGAVPAPALGLELWRSGGGDYGFELTPSLKLFSFGVAGVPEGPEDLGDSWPIPSFGGGTLGRLRLRLLADVSRYLRVVVHYEHRPRVLSSGRIFSSVATSLQGDEEVPLRLDPLEWEIAATDVAASPYDSVLGPESPTFAWEHEIDRALVTVSLPQVDITVGRQAIGWGLGRLWAPLDLFAPMSPTDLDREERRGVDALRLSLALGPSSLFEVVAAGGTSRDAEGDRDIAWSASALACLLRVNAWGVDFLLSAGKVGPDRVVGAAVAGQIRGVLLRGELTATEDERNDRFVRATVGVEFGTSINLSGTVEYHYSGFGTTDPSRYLDRAARFASRLATGQLSGLGEHYLGATLAWQPGSWGGLSLVYVQNLADGSLILGPAVEYAISDEVRLSAVALVPIGRAPRWNVVDGVPVLEARSEMGLASQMYVVQVRASI